MFFFLPMHTYWLTHYESRNTMLLSLKKSSLSVFSSVSSPFPPYCLLNRTHLLVDPLWIPKHNVLIIEKSPEQNQEHISYMCLVELFLNVIDTSVLFNIMSESRH